MISFEVRGGTENDEYKKDGGISKGSSKRKRINTRTACRNPSCIWTNNLSLGNRDKCSGFKITASKDALVSVICSGIFSVILVTCYMRMGAKTSQITSVALIFFVGIAIVGFIVLRIFAHLSHNRNNHKTFVKTTEDQPVNIFIADGNMQANMIIEALKQKEIQVYTQDLGDAGFAEVRYGMGRGLNDRLAIFVASENVDKAIKVIKGMGLGE